MGNPPPLGSAVMVRLDLWDGEAVITQANVVRHGMESEPDGFGIEFVASATTYERIQKVIGKTIEELQSSRREFNSRGEQASGESKP